MLSVMCCGCLRLLGKDGELLGTRSEDGGATDLGRLAERFKDLQVIAASFETKSDCDKAAFVHGWTVKDPGGRPNHRCPDCRLAQPETERSGAYIDWEKLLLVGANGAERVPTEAKLCT